MGRVALSRSGVIEMSQVNALAPPSLPDPASDKWRREQRAFHRLLPGLLGSHRGQFVAVHEGRIVASGPDKLAVAAQAYAQVGYVPIFVSLVTDQPAAPIRMPSPRSVERLA